MYYLVNHPTSGETYCLKVEDDVIWGCHGPMSKDEKAEIKTQENAHNLFSNNNESLDDAGWASTQLWQNWVEIPE